MCGLMIVFGIVGTLVAGPFGLLVGVIAAGFIGLKK